MLMLVFSPSLDFFLVSFVLQKLHYIIAIMNTSEIKPWCVLHSRLRTNQQCQSLLLTVVILDCKTVRIFAYSRTREQSNKRSGMRLKTESETGERRPTDVRLLHHALPISLLILRKKPTILQSIVILSVTLKSTILLLVYYCRIECSKL